MYSFEQILRIIEDAVNRLTFDGQPQSLFEPIKYTLSCGGKRIRPAFMLMACELYGALAVKALTPALGMEVFHNFTLLHDDLMDQADVRRNRPTVHRKWDANTAILSGDAMLISAYGLIGKTPEPYLAKILPLFTQTALEICEGQQFDMEFELRNNVSEDEYIEMIRLKTAVLLACCMKSGAIIGDAPEAEAEKMYVIGQNLGLAFQLQDDLLDVYGDQQTFGKKIGGDILCNKKTYLLINALKLADKEQLATLKRYYGTATNGDEKEKIAAVTAIYDTLNIRKLTEERIIHYYNKAMSELERLNVADERLEMLRDASRRLVQRQS